MVNKVVFDMFGREENKEEEKQKLASLSKQIVLSIYLRTTIISFQNMFPYPEDLGLLFWTWMLMTTSPDTSM